jgi:glycosyltransferase involved in cell wall biosynthesis
VPRMDSPRETRLVFIALQFNIERLLRRILYVQYTNPAVFPPLEHSSRILANAGWQIWFVGAGSYGAAALQFPPHDNIRVEQMGFCFPGWRQKLHYLRFAIRVAWRILTWRPAWVYFSLPLDALLAWLTSCVPGVQVIYHEHDCPPPDSRGASLLAEWPRRWLFQRVLCIWPSLRRAQIAAPECEHPRIVWNCPRREEVAPPREPAVAGELRIFYHGSINAKRLPLAMVQSLALLPAGVSLTVVGYETVGSGNHGERLRDEAARLGLGSRVVFPGQKSRFESMQICRSQDVGITFMPLETTDVNEDNMVGPSNKAFDYLACGLALLMADRPDWRETFAGASAARSEDRSLVPDGLGLVCDPEDPASIASALRWFLDHPAETRAMGERGRQRILLDWNYDSQFLAIQRIMEAVVG